MRVLQIVREFPPDEVAGIGTYAAALTAGLVRAGQETFVISPSQTADSRSYQFAGAGVSRPGTDYPGSSNAAASSSQALTVAYAAAWRDKAGPADVINVHSWQLAQAGALLSEMWDVPLIATFHYTDGGRREAMGDRPETAAPVTKVEKWLGRRARRVIAVSQFLRYELTTQIGVPSRKIDVVPAVAPPRARAALTSDRLTLFRECLGEEGDRIVLYIGRLSEEKGVDVLLEGFRLLLRKGLRARLVVAGSGPHHDALRQQCQSLGLSDHSTFTGYVSGSVKESLLACADVVVIPSRYEALGIVALEAVQQRRPVVASDVGGLPEIVKHAESGILVTPGEPEELAEGIESVLRDRRRAGVLAEEAFRHVNTHFHENEATEQTLASYARCVEPAPVDASEDADRVAAAPREPVLGGLT